MSSGNAEKVPHNDVTVTLRKEPQGNFVLNLILRNNRTTPSRPYGIFHPREELPSHQKENIGLIEAMGLGAILPGRLDKELKGNKRVLCGEIPCAPIGILRITAAMSKQKHMALYKHKHWIDGTSDPLCK